MKPQFLTIPCTSNDEYGDLSNCYAFVNLNGLYKILNLMRDLREQRPNSTVLQTMNKFPFEDFPVALVEKDNLKTDENINDFCLVSSFYTNEEVNIWDSNINLLVLPNDEYNFQYEMTIKDCQTIVYTNLITEETLKSIIKEWENLLKANT